MATIKEGFAGEPFEIRVNASEGRAEIWTDMRIDFTRIETAYGVEGTKAIRQEYLHYGTITELIELRDEINRAIKEMAGV